MSSIEPTLDDFYARGEAVRVLIDDFNAYRFAPATLVAGAPGIGKKALLSLLAKGLLCIAKEGRRPCGVCRACKRFDAKTHPDLLYPEIPAKEKAIKVEAIRGILDMLSRHSFEGGRRVVLIENAERMTPQAQNCLLKSLEEADESTFFLFSADRETAILPTIRSRCRIVRMQPMQEALIEEILIAQGCPNDAAKRTAKLCEGSLGAAKAILSDEKDGALRSKVRATFLSIKSAADIPAASFQLKDDKENADKLLVILEQELHLLLRGGEYESVAASGWKDRTPSGIARMLSAVITARKMRFSNVNWQAAADQLLETIAEEVQKWQP